MTMLRAIAVLALVLLSGTARAGDYTAPREADWIARDFKFHTGEVMPELKFITSRSAIRRDYRFCASR